LRKFLIVSELGLILLDERKKPLAKFAYPIEDRARRFLDSSSGVFTEEELGWLNENLKTGDVTISDPVILQGLKDLSSKSALEPVSEPDQREFRRTQISMAVQSGLAQSEEAAEEAIRDVSVALSSLRIKEMSSNPDLQAMESVQALDEVDKTANILSSRLREWYGLHFPELVSMIEDNISLAKLVINFKSRSNFDANLLEQMGFSKAKSKAIESAAQNSRGADLREDDLARIIQLAEEAQRLFSLRDKLASHVEKTMREVAPNLTEVAGATIGARLIARAGGLRKLSIMPASTIQILGAEKALYRALKSGARPPKHGILFQHAAVHSAPKWQRGKVARSVAGKLAIAARIDSFRGSKDESIMNSLQSRLDEIRVKYKEAPRESERKEYAPRTQRRFEPRQRDDRGGDRGRPAGERRDSRPPYKNRGPKRYGKPGQQKHDRR
jgi:nucleolar protein 56